MAHFDPMGTTALITGASSGFGVEFAHRFAERGADLVLVARRKDRLDALASELTQKYGSTVTTIALDLTAPDAVASVRGRLAASAITVSSLVNNAGFGGFGAFAEMDPAVVDGQVALNVAALVSLTRTFLPELLSSGNGALVNVASTAAFQPVPRMAVYGASKAFVLSFTEALWYEVKGSGLRVTALCPGPAHTEFAEIAENEPAMIGVWATAREVVDAAMAALDRRVTPPSMINTRRNAIQAKGALVAPRRLMINTVGRMTGRR
ncbi:SDR family oxidoreductase [soil metagenome]